MITFLLFIIGFLLLIKGADYLVSGASSLAYKLGVAPLVIGLTIVAFGTSAPELIVNLMASMSGNTDIAIGNILGSNIVNILIILGVSAIIYPIAVQKSTVWKEIPFALLAVVVMAFMASDALIDGAGSSYLSRIDGLVLISFFVIFLCYIIGLAKESPNETAEKPLDMTRARSILFIIGGLVALVIGGKWIVDGAVIFAQSFGVSESLIGLTIVAIGTSLPELATSVVAAYKKNTDIAIGNIVGSNIFNIFFILGTTSLFRTVPIVSNNLLDIFVLLVGTIFLFATGFLYKKHTIDRREGAVMILGYFVYLAYIITRG